MKKVRENWEKKINESTNIRHISTICFLKLLLATFAYHSSAVTVAATFH